MENNTCTYFQCTCVGLCFYCYVLLSIMFNNMCVTLFVSFRACVLLFILVFIGTAFMETIAIRAWNAEKCSKLGDYA